MIEPLEGRVLLSADLPTTTTSLAVTRADADSILLTAKVTASDGSVPGGEVEFIQDEGALGEGGVIDPSTRNQWVIVGEGSISVDGAAQLSVKSWDSSWLVSDSLSEAQFGAVFLGADALIDDPSVGPAANNSLQSSISNAVTTNVRPTVTNAYHLDSSTVGDPAAIFVGLSMPVAWGSPVGWDWESWGYGPQTFGIKTIRGENVASATGVGFSGSGAASDDVYLGDPWQIELGRDGWENSDGPRPTGTLTISEGDHAIDTIDISQGIFAWEPEPGSLSLGEHDFTVTYSGDENYLGSSTTTQINVSLAATRVAISPSDNQIFYAGSPISFSAKVTTAVPDLSAPTGTVTFSEGANVLETAELGDLTPIILNLPAGAHTINVAYSGDDYRAASSSSVTVNVVKATTQTQIKSDHPAIMNVGDTLSLTANVTNVSGNDSVPSGTITFHEGDSLLGVRQVGDTTPLQVTLPVGAHTITASYSGDDNCATSTASLSVNVVIPTESTISFSRDSVGGTFTAKVSAADGSIPTGYIDLLRDGAIIQQAAIDPSGSATIKQSPMVYGGKYQIVYLGLGASSLTGVGSGESDVYAASISDGVSTKTIGTADVSPLNAFFPYTELRARIILGDVYAGEYIYPQSNDLGGLIATVPWNPGGLDSELLSVPHQPFPAPTGVAHFYEAGVLVGTGTFDSDGNAIWSPDSALTALAAGTHQIHVAYDGDAYYAPMEGDGSVSVADGWDFSQSSGQGNTSGNGSNGDSFGTQSQAQFQTPPTVKTTASLSLPSSKLRKQYPFALLVTYASKKNVPDVDRGVVIVDGMLFEMLESNDLSAAAVAPGKRATRTAYSSIDLSRLSLGKHKIVVGFEPNGMYKASNTKTYRVTVTKKGIKLS